jgi:hypothetical protein
MSLSAVETLRVTNSDLEGNDCSLGQFKMRHI